MIEHFQKIPFNLSLFFPVIIFFAFGLFLAWWLWYKHAKRLRLALTTNKNLNADFATIKAKDYNLGTKFNGLLNNQRDQYTAQIQHRDQNLSKATTLISGLQNKEKTLNLKISEEGNRFNDLNLLFGKLKKDKDSEITGLLSQQQSLKHDLDGKAKAQIDLEAKVKNQDGKILDLHQQVKDRQAQIDSINNDLTELNGTLSDRESQIGNLNGQLRDKDGELHTLKGDLDGTKGELGSKIAAFGLLQTQFDDNNGETDNLRNLLSERDENINSLNGKLGEKEESLTLLKTQLDESNHYLGEKDAKLNELDTKYSERKQEVHSLKGDLDGTKGELGSKIAAFGLLQTQFDDNSSEAENLRQKLNERDEHINSLNARFSEKEEGLALLQTQLDESNHFLGERDAKLGEQDAQISEFDQQLEAKNKHVADLQKLLNGRTDELSGLQNQINDRQAEIDEIKGQPNESDELRNQLHAANGELEETRKDLGNKLNELGKLRSEFDQHQEEIDKLNGLISGKEQELTDLQGAHGELNLNIGNLEDNLKDRESKIQELESNLGEKDSDLAEKANAFGLLQTQLDESNHYLGERDAQLSERDAQLNESQAQLHEREKEVSNLQGDLDGTKGELSSKVAAFGLLQTQLHETEQKAADTSELDQEKQAHATVKQKLVTTTDKLSAAERALHEEQNKKPAPIGAATFFANTSAASSDRHGFLYKSKPQQTDDLTEISGVGPVLQPRLNDFGVYQFKQIALWNQDNIDAFSEDLDFPGRVEREQWVNQAADLHREHHDEHLAPIVNIYHKAKPRTVIKASEDSSLEDDFKGENIKLDEKLGILYNERPENVDDLKRIKGVAKVLEGNLHKFGVYRFKQIALWHKSHIDEFSEALAFPDRIERDQWIAQSLQFHNEEYEERLAPRHTVYHNVPTPKKPEPPKGALAAFVGEPVKNDKELGIIYTKAPAEVDDLKLIKGVAKVLEGKLNDFGIYRFKQIATWTPEQIAAFTEKLSFPDRIERDEWVKQSAAFHIEKYGF